MSVFAHRCARRHRFPPRSAARACQPGGLVRYASLRHYPCRPLRYAVRLNGITSLALTKLDVLSAFGELPVCVRYSLPDGSETDEFPAHQSDFHHCRPDYETLAGWNAPLDVVESLEGLPPAARRYVEFVEQELGIPVALVGTGAERERVLRRAA